MTMRSKILAHRYQMVAANDIFQGCQEHFVTAILAVLRPKILIPGVTIYNRDDMTREALFLEEGELEVYADDDTVPYRVVRPTETLFPVAGAVAFFLGIPQPFAHKASTKSHVKLLTLSRDDYENIKVGVGEGRRPLPRFPFPPFHSFFCPAPLADRTATPSRGTSSSRTSRPGSASSRATVRACVRACCACCTSLCPSPTDPSRQHE